MAKVLFYLVLVVCAFVLQWSAESLRNEYSSTFLWSAPNFISAAFFGTLCALWFVNGEPSGSLSFTAGLVVYEFLQLAIPERTFDVMDIVASVLGFGLSVFILSYYRRVSFIQRLNSAKESSNV
jgi:hypothetical protein